MACYLDPSATSGPTSTSLNVNHGSETYLLEQILGLWIEIIAEERLKPGDSILL
jgi:hypothetical protein